MKRVALFASVIFALCATACQRTADSMQDKIDKLSQDIAMQQHEYDKVMKAVDDLLWYEKVGDIAYIDKIRITGPARWKPKSADDRFAANRLQFYTYVFIPKSVDRSAKYPLIVLPHSGIHSDFSTYYAHIVRELVAQGYIIVSAEYRGSTGYGRTTYENIDYGGRENDDVLASRDHMVQNYSIVDSTRIGIVGWSHGGMIALMQILRCPESYNCAFAGVPVSDLHSRLASHDADYHAYFTAPYHIGESIEQNPMEYTRRSPSYYAHLLERPLLIHTTTNDNDVYVEEVQLMIDSLKAHNRAFDYKVVTDADGGHGMDRIDTREAQELRYLIHQFLAQHLNPPRPFDNPNAMRRAAYRFD